jgi:hypothetical protein
VAKDRPQKDQPKRRDVRDFPGSPDSSYVEPNSLPGRESDDIDTDLPGRRRAPPLP